MRKPARAALAAAAAGLALSAAPYAPAKAHHCQAILIFSGVYNEEAKQGQTINLGAGGCANDDEGLNTNVLTPGSNVLRIGSSPTPVEGTVDIDGVVTPLVFTWNAGSSRWDSQRVPSLGAQRATATVKTITGYTVSVTYTAVPQASL